MNAASTYTEGMGFAQGKAVTQHARDLHFIRRSAEFLKKDQVTSIAHGLGLRGIYVLYMEEVKNGSKRYDVRYVGMSRKGSLRARLMHHLASKRKKDKWTHFSVFVVWDDITNEEIEEIEGFARHIYRRDPTANTLNIQKGFAKLRDGGVRNNEISRWR